MFRRRTAGQYCDTGHKVPYARCQASRRLAPAKRLASQTITFIVLHAFKFYIGTALMTTSSAHTVAPKSFPSNFLGVTRSCNAVPLW